MDEKKPDASAEETSSSGHANEPRFVKPRFFEQPGLAIIISAFFILQFLGMVICSTKLFDYFSKLVDRGYASWPDVAIMMAFPAVAFLGSVALLFRMRVSAVLFACYWVPGMAFLIAGRSGWAGYMNIPITFAATLYCMYLSKKGWLR